MRALPRVEVVVETETLERSTRGGITGRVWLRDGRQDTQADFPEVGWSDFPVALLHAWIADVECFARDVPASGAVVKCRFMDGPYSFTVVAEQPGAWRIRCSEDRLEGRSEPGPQWLTDQSSFLRSLYRAGRSVLAHCDSRGWWNADTEALRRRIKPGS
jgi:hypothetical protein